MLLTGAAAPAFAQALNMPSGSVTTTGNPDSTTAISSDPSSTQRKGTHLSAAAHREANMEEAETTKQLNEQAPLWPGPAPRSSNESIIFQGPGVRAPGLFFVAFH